MGNVDAERKRFAELLARYHAGDPDAIAALYASYNQVIRAAVRRRLPNQLRQEFDSLDFAQDVWAAFFALPAEKYQFPTKQALQGFLTRIAYNKVTDTCRRRLESQGYTVKREQPLVPLPSPDPTPSQWAIAGEKWAEIAAGLPPSNVAIFERLREGFSHEEVAKMTGLSVRTVFRIVERVHRKCEDAL